MKTKEIDIYKIIERYNKAGRNNYAPERISNSLCVYLHTYTGEDEHDISIYEFIINPKYKYLDHFHNCKEWQDEFWVWMEKTEKVTLVDHSFENKEDYIFCLNDFVKTSTRKRYIPKQMLTGYIIEFLMED